MSAVFVQLNEGSRFAERYPVGYVIQANGCWEWVGRRTYQGYGSWFFGGRMHFAHRVLYERAKGTVPDGLVIDHLCRKRDCVNPDHLEAVTNKENILRGAGAPAVNSRKTHCLKGHPYAEEGIMQRNGKRRCRICRRASDLASYHRRAKRA